MKIPVVKIYPDPDSLFRGAAERFEEIYTESIRFSDKFSVVLAGGSTPRGLYNLLASGSEGCSIDWSRIHFFWGDERCLPPEHPESNYNMVYNAMLRDLNLNQPETHTHRIIGEEEPGRAAELYTAVIEEYFSGRDKVRFDLVLLGLGADGHTASLFPGSPVLQENNKIVAPVLKPGIPGPARVTLTFPALNASAKIIFLISGESKAAMVRRLINGDISEELPASMVRPVDGTVEFLLDEQAASLLSSA